MRTTCPECGHTFETEKWLDLNKPLKCGTCFECKRTDVPGYWTVAGIFKCVYCMGRNE